jgi:hypothetical protein
MYRVTVQAHYWRVQRWIMRTFIQFQGLSLIFAIGENLLCPIQCKFTAIGRLDSCGSVTHRYFSGLGSGISDSLT